MLIVGCSQPESPVGSDVGPDIGGQVKTVTYPATFDSSFTAPFISTASGPWLYVGNAEGMDCKSLLRFNRPPERDSSKVVSGTVSVYWKGQATRSGGATPGLSADMLDYAWSEASKLTYDSLSSISAIAPLTQDSISTPTDSTGFIRWSIPFEQLQSWFTYIDSSAIKDGWVGTRADTGLSVKISAPAALKKILRLYSKDGTADSLWMRPTLKLRMQRLDTTGVYQPDSMTIIASGDMYLIKDTNSLVNDTLAIGRGSVYRSVVKFGTLDSLLKKANRQPIVVNKAYLTLHRNKNAYQWATPTPGVNVGFLWDNAWLTKPDSISATFGASVAIDSTADSIEINVTSQLFTRIRKEDFGMIIRGEFEDTEIDRIAFYTSTDPDPARRPKLTVIYTEFPQ